MLARSGSPDVPNDHVIFDPEHTLLTYYVASAAKATVVANGRGGIIAERASVRQLVQVVTGRRKTFEPGNPFWMTVSGDTVIALDQQYSP